MEVKSVTVRLPEPLHRAVKVRCAERGDSLEGVARAAFVAYLERDASEAGSVLERAGVRPAGLAAGDKPDGRQTTSAGNSGSQVKDGESRLPSHPPASHNREHGADAIRPAPAASPSFRPDPKRGSR